MGGWSWFDIRLYLHAVKHRFKILCHKIPLGTGIRVLMTYKVFLMLLSLTTTTSLFFTGRSSLFLAIMLLKLVFMLMGLPRSSKRMMVILLVPSIGSTPPARATAWATVRFSLTRYSPVFSPRPRHRQYRRRAHGRHRHCGLGCSTLELARLPAAGDRLPRFRSWG